MDILMIPALLSTEAPGDYSRAPFFGRDYRHALPSDESGQHARYRRGLGAFGHRDDSQSLPEIGVNQRIFGGLIFLGQRLYFRSLERQRRYFFRS